MKNQFFKEYWCSKLITYHICSDLASNKISKVRYSTSEHEYLTFDIYYALKLKRKNLWILYIRKLSFFSNFVSLCYTKDILLLFSFVEIYLCNILQYIQSKKLNLKIIFLTDRVYFNIYILGAARTLVNPEKFGHPGFNRWRHR